MAVVALLLPTRLDLPECLSLVFAPLVLQALPWPPVAALHSLERELPAWLRFGRGLRGAAVIHLPDVLQRALGQASSM